MKGKSKCFEEIIYYKFADNELEPGERKKVNNHLKTCNTCGKFVENIKAENVALGEIFETGTGSPDLAPGIIKRLNKKRFILFSARGLAYAATFLLAVFLFVFLFTHKPDKTREDVHQVLVHSARVEGQAAQPHIFESKDPDVKFIWLEKFENKKREMEGTNETII